MRRFLILALTLWSGFAAAETADESRREMIEDFQCHVTEMLQEVYWRPVVKYNRFLVLTRGNQNYVQCMFAEERKKLFCEASSGYYGPRIGDKRPHLPAKSLTALARLGFDTSDSDKNFPYERDLVQTPDFDEIAALMLGALHDAYGARAGDKILMRGTFRNKDVTSDLRCGGA